ncbi:bifunctional [glutamate--ammonia ligase]-adenylyl-L-tyrosine phosphorylase/[glutamate--ammonia-ligase] adenylyltransferase, partial [bacterium]|nr:bifunctional [glutamate--ammonia ligase]-adenylyl-L-tyrosine phosphorylase/[glutamate--ammonia-ligase] adenylyltransferase [bacterium]
NMMYAVDLRQATRACDSSKSLAKVFRKYRTEAMMRIIWRDINRIASTHETMREVSLLASACIDVGVDRLYRDACARYGTPIGARTCAPVEMVVFGMGKLGGAELNLSSDIDLIFSYPDDGETDVSSMAAPSSAKPMSNHEFFSRVGKSLIHLLDAVTAEGFVFRVDMRLRPYGASGPLVMSFDAMETYYETQGREWERYAMIKAIPIAGDCDAGQQLLSALQPFIYRRYLDFGAIQSLRDMKLLIEQEVVRRSMFDDIKLGAGGIREIEFVVQSFQLIYGGRNPQLQTSVLINALNGLLSEAYLDSTVVAQLKEAYAFFRDTEHALQAWRDEQTQRLPVDDELGQARLAFAMAYDDWSSFYAVLEVHRQHVSAIFADVVKATAERTPSDHVGRQWFDFWQLNDDEGRFVDALALIGFEDPVSALRSVWQLRDSPKVNAMEAVSRARLDKFMPMLLDAVAASDEPDQVLRRLLPFVESVLRRTAYLALLNENPPALKRLVRYFESSEWVSDQLTRYPALLDELLDTQHLASVPSVESLQDELRQQLLRIPEDDLEMAMEVLRHFKRGHGLRVAAAEIDGLIPLMRVSDYLSFVADTVLNAVFDMAWAQLIERYGSPVREDGSACQRDFLIVAYGKLGGYELGHQSDLDLVFIYEAAAQQMTMGEDDVPGAQAVDNAVFFTRLGQRIIHILTTVTAGGQLYEVDMRLRPSGASGLLVTTFASFSDYQHDRAWTWEHQALSRARVVAGNGELSQRFVDLREDVLSLSRDKAALKADVLDMRNKMREHLSAEDAPIDVE